MCDLSEHPFAIFMAGERITESVKDRQWASWLKTVKTLCADILHLDYRGKISLDGTESLDGYSLDSAYDAFEDGVSAYEYAMDVRANVAAFSPASCWI